MKFLVSTWLSSAMMWGLAVGFSAAPALAKGPLEVSEAVKSFQISPDLKIQLVASEPQVVDPVDLAFDETGRLWVAEMRDYPNGPKAGEKPTSRIKILQDRDGDGVYETATTFADELLFVTGLLPWKGGVIVTYAGRVAWLVDTDGDNKADQHEVWLEGFAEENPQLRANHPTLGPDGWIYIANGLRGGIVNVVHPEWPKLAEPISLRGRDFRFHPGTGRCESIAGNGQYGMSFDAWGNRLICSNRNPAMQVMFQFDHLSQQPLLIVPSLVNDISPAGEDSRLFPLTGNWTTSNLHAGQYTAACGVHSYQGTAMPEKFRDAVFTCDPTANLVHGDILEIQGASFRSPNPHQPQEFLASRDEWFRPVNLKTGPDGALYVVDMYRAVIEHPQFMPEELKNRPDLVLGNDRGRLWKVVSSASTKNSPTPLTFPAQATFADLVPSLTADNVWQRQTAYRLIVEQLDAQPELVSELQTLWQQQPTAAASQLVLSLLQQSGALTAEDLIAALKDESPQLRRFALQLAEPLLSVENLSAKTSSSTSSAALKEAIFAAVQDPHPHVCFQALIALRNHTHEFDNFPAAVAESLLKQPADPWLQKASLLGIQERLPELLELTLKNSGSSATAAESQKAADYAQEIARLIGRLNQPALTQQVLTFLFDGEQPAVSSLSASAVLRGLGEGLRSRGQSLNSLLTAIEQAPKFQNFVSELIAQAEQSENHDLQYQALATMKELPSEEVSELLLKIVEERSSPTDLRTAALAALRGKAVMKTPETQQMLLEMIRSESPVMRRELIDYCLSDTSATLQLLESMQKGRLKYRELAADQINRLSRSQNSEVRQLQSALQAQLKDTNLEQVIADYLKVLNNTELTEEQAHRGLIVFNQQCATCHRMGEHGTAVGPDISDTRTKRPDDLLVNIIDPNKAIDNNYFSYTAVTIDGRIHTGILSEETPYAITLKQSKGESQTLQREEIEEFASDGVSFMPQGLEKNISPEQMVDLISFLKNWRYLEGNVPLK